MSEKAKKISLIIVLCILTIIGTLLGIFYPNEPINNTIGEYQKKWDCFCVNAQNAVDIALQQPYYVTRKQMNNT